MITTATKCALLPAAAVLIAVAMHGCGLRDPSRQMQTKDRPSHLIATGPAVDRLLAVQRAQEAQAARFWQEAHSKEERRKRVEELLRNPERYYPGRGNFLFAMAEQPSESVPASSYLLVLEDSKVKCGRPIETTDFVKVRVTSGLLDGRVGWACEDDILRTVTMP